MKFKDFCVNITVIIPIIKAVKAIIEYNRNAPEILKAVKDLKELFKQLQERENEVEEFKRIMSDD